jgi:anti-anti-sigma factor
VIIDCEKLVYVSSAGLRVLLALNKKIKNCLTLENVQELVMEVLEVTGFVNILKIK